MPLLGYNFNVKTRQSLFRCRIDVVIEGGEMHFLSQRLIAAKLAIEVPEIHSWRQRHTPLAFDVFANLMLDGLQQSFRMLAFDLEIEQFFQLSLFFCWLRG